MIPLYDSIRGRRFPFLTLALIAANFAVFVFWQQRVGIGYSAAEEGLIPRQITGTAGVTLDGLSHLLTYQFLHGGWLHLLSNLWFLWIFGFSVENNLGPARFFIFYLLCGAAAGLAQAFLVPPDSAGLPLVGASGSISGVLGAYVALYPRARIITLVPLVIIARVLPVPAWVFLLIWIGLQVFSQAQIQAAIAGRPPGLTTAQPNVAYLAHIGGFLAGLGLVWVFRRRGPDAGPPRLRNGGVANKQNDLQSERG